MDEARRIGQTIPKPIQLLQGLNPTQLEALKSHWITTVDALVAAAATGEGRAGVCRTLCIDTDQLDQLLQTARGLLGEMRYRQLLAASPGGPTGALFDIDENQSTDESAAGDHES